MRTFEQFQATSECPICHSNENKPCILVAIDGTEDGNICEAQPVHVDCLMETRWSYRKDLKIIYTMVE